MLKWIKKGLIFNPLKMEDRPQWMCEFAQAPNTVLFENFIRVFFTTRPKPDNNGQYHG